MSLQIAKVIQEKLPGTSYCECGKENLDDLISEFIDQATGRGLNPGDEQDWEKKV